ncbi:hypothetical protein K449DRAFT_403275 [Hypoxylon sp. EC38]|nr:hypothetical protein K449DRAFT_403275 [Hypoxylon sp. EC38]
MRFHHSYCDHIRDPIAFASLSYPPVNEPPLSLNYTHCRQEPLARGTHINAIKYFSSRASDTAAKWGDAMNNQGTHKVRGSSQGHHTFRISLAMMICAYRSEWYGFTMKTFTMQSSLDERSESPSLKSRYLNLKIGTTHANDLPQDFLLLYFGLLYHGILLVIKFNIALQQWIMNIMDVRYTLAGDTMIIKVTPVLPIDSLARVMLSRIQE